MISEGLNEGERVVTGRQLLLQPGALSSRSSRAAGARADVRRGVRLPPSIALSGSASGAVRCRPVCAPFVASLLKLEVRCFKRPALI